MIDLKVTREETDLELAPGVLVRVRPCSSAIMLAARSELRNEGGAEEQYGRMIRALARAAITSWEGIAFGGEPAPVTPENIDAVMEIWPLFRAFEDQYYGRVMTLDAEKNA